MNSNSIPSDPKKLPPKGHVSGVKAECLLLAINGRYYYGESFTKFIEINARDYERILRCPYLFYFSTALEKHVAWCKANREGMTLTFSQAAEQSPPPSDLSETEKVPFEKLPRKAQRSSAASETKAAPTRRSIRTSLLQSCRRLREGAWRFYDRWILNPHDLIVIGIAEAVRRRVDAKTIADAFPAPRASDAAELLIERLAKSRVASMVAAFLDRWEKLASAAKVVSVAIAALVIGVIYSCWSGDPVNLTFGGIFDTVFLGIGLILFVLLPLALFLVELLLLLGVIFNLWRAAEIVSGFVARHLVPFGLRFRYRSWRLRRLTQRTLARKAWARFFA